MLTLERLREKLSFDPDTGLFVWRIAGGKRRVGDVAGRVNCRGYISLVIDLRTYQGHRLAWLYHYGSWPPGQLDHVNRDRADNRIKNLRVATASQNAANRAAGGPHKKGVTRLPCGRFQASIKHQGKSHYLGLHASESAAHDAYAQAAAKLFGSFARAA